jgi:hypothetical protein
MGRNKKFGKARGNKKNIAKNAKRIKNNLEILKKLDSK